MKKSRYSQHSYFEDGELLHKIQEEDTRNRTRRTVSLILVPSRVQIGLGEQFLSSWFLAEFK